jgi:hypothetical protein
MSGAEIELDRGWSHEGSAVTNPSDPVGLPFTTIASDTITITDTAMIADLDVASSSTTLGAATSSSS